MAKWYVVYSGRVLGLYEEWKDCQAQVTNFSGNYKGYKTRELAVSKWRRHM
jgi:viroplasmin and RNaseH domain-containing protein